MSVFKYFKINEAPEGYEFNSKGFISLLTTERLVDSKRYQRDKKLPNLITPKSGPAGQSKFARRRFLTSPKKVSPDRNVQKIVREARQLIENMDGIVKNEN